jgi:signal transduction histidine kinase/CheY-like chemotaxis protein/ABC-type amino acid transport substrate-binding protein
MNKIIAAALAVIIILTAVSACAKDSRPVDSHDLAQSPFASFRDIPGVTHEEIAAIEALQRGHKSFVYAMTLSTEAFLKESGEGSESDAGETAVGGYAALFCEWLTDLFGIQFKPEIYAWSDLVEKLNAGEIDFAGNLTPTEERQKIYFMTDPIAERQYKTIQLAGSPSLDRIALTRPLRYVFMEGAAIAGTVASVTESGTYEAIFVNNYEEAYRALENADAFIGDSAVVLSFDAYGDVHEGDFLPLIFSPVSMATAKDELEPVISVITKAQRNGAMPYLNNLFNQGHDEYKRHKFFTHLNDEEKAYLRDTVSVPLVTQYFNYPIVFYDTHDKKWDGISFELLHEVEKLTGLTFKVVNDEYTEMPDLIAMLSDGRGHIFTDLIFTKEREPHFIWNNNKFMTDQYALLSKIDYPNVNINEILHKRIALVKSTAHEEMFRTWFPDADNTTEVNSLNDAFMALEQGEVDLVMAAKTKLLYYLNYFESSGYKANFLFNYSYESAFAFNKDQTVLCSIVDKAFLLIDSSVVVEQWLTKTYDYQYKIIEAQRPWLIGAIVLSFIVLALVLILFYRSYFDRKRLVKEEAQVMAREADERTKIMLDSTPLSCSLIDRDYNFIDCNKEAERLFGVANKQEYINNFFEFSPEYQPDGQKSQDKAHSLFKKTFNTGYTNVEWQHLINGEKVPCDVTLVRVKYYDDYIIAGYTQDLRKLKEAETKTREADERIQLMLEYTPLIVMLWDRNMQILDCNEEAVRILGLSSKKEYMERFFKLVPKYQPCGMTSVEMAHKELNHAFNYGYDRFEWTIRHSLTGEEIPFEITLFRIKYKDGYAVLSYAQDLRERNAAIAKIREADERTQLMVEQAPLVVMLWDKNLQILDCNQEAVRLFGLSSKKEYMEKFFSLAPEYQPNGLTSLEMAQKALMQVLETGYGRIEWVLKHAVTGEEIPFDTTLARVKYKDENIVISYALDMRERNAVMARMRETDERAQILFDTAPLASCMFNKDFNMFDCNQAVVEMFGIPDKEFFLYRFFELFPEYQSNGVLSVGEATRNILIAFEEGYHHFELMQQKLNGALLPVEITLIRVKYRNEYVIAAYFRDLSEQKVMMQLTRQQAEAEAANRAKSSFLATMSHEMRTPMNAILGISEIHLQKQNLMPDTEKAFRKIYESGDLLLKILNDILDLSKIEAGKLELIPVEYNLLSIINDTAQLNYLRYESKPIIFTLHIEKNTPTTLFGDELRIRQVLNNILSNAFKYTNEGKIEFFVSSDTDELDGNVIIIFRVNDTGQGMTESQIEKLFDEYIRFNVETNRTTIGAGLGMSIAKRLIELMDGNIVVESEPDKGSVFTVCIPQKRIGTSVCESAISSKLNDFSFKSASILKKMQLSREYMPYGSVLVVDDVETNLYVVMGMLDPYGLKVETVSSGFSAIEKIKNGRVYDIVFMDYMMPKMDGIETVKIIREMGYTHTIVALTADALVGQAEMFLQNGFDGYISKPVDSSELNLLLNEFIRDRKPPAVVEAARKEQDDKSQNNKNVSGQVVLKGDDVDKFFIRDAGKALNALEKLYKKIDNLHDDDIELYNVTVHGMKSALANIGEKELSAIAYNLEQAGMNRNTGVMSAETPVFINALQSLVKKFKPVEEENDLEISAEDLNFLREKLVEIKTACMTFDNNTVKTALNDLRQKKWSNHINNVLDEIAAYILHSKFKAAADIAENAEKTIKI